MSVRIPGGALSTLHGVQALEAAACRVAGLELL